MTDSTNGELNDDGEKLADNVQDIDALIAAEDPTFLKAMTDLAAIPVPKDVNLTEEISDEEFAATGTASGASGWTMAIVRWRHFRNSVRATLVRAKELALRPKLIWEEFRKGAIPYLKQLALKAWTWLRTDGKDAIKHFFAQLGEGWQSFTYFVRYSEKRQKLLMLYSAILFALGIASALFAFRNQRLLFWQEPEFLSFTQVANETWGIEENEAMFDFYGSWLSPQFYVELEKMVINLRPTADSPLPMGAFRFYLEGSTQETAVELKDREKEMRNIIQLKVRELSFDELSSPTGMSRCKELIAGAINEVLTQGRVRRVLIDTLVLKP